MSDQDNLPDPAHVVMPPDLCRFPRDNWHDSNFGFLRDLGLEEKSRHGDIAKQYWAGREASVAWSRALQSGNIDDALPPSFESKHPSARTKKQKAENNKQRRSALSCSLYAAVADKALEM